MRWIVWLVVFTLMLSFVTAVSYVADISVLTSKTVYNQNESMEIKGKFFLSNYSNNGSLVVNRSLFNGNITLWIINKNTSAIVSNLTLNVTSGEFYTNSSFYPNAPRLSAPANTGNYYLRANYTDNNGTAWWTHNQIEVVGLVIDKLLVSTDKLSYAANEPMIITVEAVRSVDSQLVYIPNLAVNGSMRNSSKDKLSAFNCTTQSNGRCSINTTAPSSYGEYWVDVNDFKAFSPFNVERFKINVGMKDEFGETIKHTFDTNEQASVEVAVLTNSTSDTYTFSGFIQDSQGVVVKTINSTDLNINNSYTNRFTFTLDAVNFASGNYFVNVNVTKQDGGIVSGSTAFTLQSWSLSVKKKEVGSNFDYGYNAFAGKTVLLEIYPTSTNSSLITSLNVSTDINISLLDKMGNKLLSANATWNSTCSTSGCYPFNFSLPNISSSYSLVVAVNYAGTAQHFIQQITVISALLTAQTTDKDAAFKELFSTDEFVFLSLSSTNSTSNFNLTNASVASVVYMNGTEFSYTEVASFAAVNSSNTALEWAWNSTSQSLKLDTPTAGGVYTVYLNAQNNTAATSVRFTVNPYEMCLVAKNTPAQVSTAGGSASGYYYVYQFKTSDTIYFELKLTQATNPVGRATFANYTNSSYGMGRQCTIDTTRQSAISNATISISEVINTQSGKSFTLNSSESSCSADDNSGGYTCTLKPIGDWDGGSYGVKFKVLGPDGQTSDISYGFFEARAFYLYAWSPNYQNKPNSSITLNVYMYEAGNNWWGSFGSGGLGGTVEVKKVEYQGSGNDWLQSSIDYDYNVSKLNTTTITNGNGVLTLPVNNTPLGTWKTGYYRVLLKGTDSAGNVDYGQAWFSIKRWEILASPVDCSQGTCISVSNVNTRSNVSLYVMINNAGEWGQSGNALGGIVSLRVKKIMDCRKWPCTELNSSSYTSTTLNLTKSSSWYTSSSVNTSYTLNVSILNGNWGTGYWQVAIDANNSESGMGWFNTISFYAETQPTDQTGSQWKYNIRPNQPAYFKVTSTKSQKSGSYYGSYNTSDLLNTSITAAVIRTWDQSTYQSKEYNYPTDFNISPTIVNGSKVINLSYLAGNWPSGYFNGELTLKDNLTNDTSTAFVWFNVQSFRTQISTNSYNLDSTSCVNGTITVVDPDWYSNTPLTGNYTISGVTESVWSGSSNTITTYTNYTPTGNFSANTTFTVCPNDGRWGSGSWGGYHYLTIKVKDNSTNITQDGWVSFRAIPFQISWGSMVGGTTQSSNANITIPVTLQTSAGSASSGYLSRIYQQRWDSETYRNEVETYSYTVGSCNGSTSSPCQINGTKNITIVVPAAGWKDGYNYMYTEWKEAANSTTTLSDYSGLWFNAAAAYTGWFSNQDQNNNWKYQFGLGENLTIKLEVRNSSSSPATVTLNKVEYSTPSDSCWTEGCRTYNTATWNLTGNSSGTQVVSSAIIKIIKPAANWTKGYVYIRVNVTGTAGTATIKNGFIQVKDLTAPSLTMVAPVTGANITTNSFGINWTTSESTTCYVNVYNFGNFYNSYCQNSYYNTTSQSYCNNSLYSGNTSYSSYVSKDHKSWSINNTWGWSSGTTGLSTGGITHAYTFNTTGMTAQHYGLQIYCNDVDWNNAYGWATFKVNITG